MMLRMLLRPPLVAASAALAVALAVPPRFARAGCWFSKTWSLKVSSEQSSTNKTNKTRSSLTKKKRARTTPDDLNDAEEYKEIYDDIKDECSTMGTLVSFKIPRRGDGYSSDSVGKVYLEYSTLGEAIGAGGQLSGREFGDNVVEVEYLDETDYLNGKF